MEGDHAPNCHTRVRNRDHQEGPRGFLPNELLYKLKSELLGLLKCKRSNEVEFFVDTKI